MRHRLRNGAVISILPQGALVRLSDGTVIRSRPHDTDEYRATAEQLGYGADTLALCQQHDVLHVLLADWLSLGDSRSLRVAAGLEPASEISEAEERAVIAVQRLLRLAGVPLPVA